ncbi:MAG: aminopeptidase [Eubacterium sp.]|nr:aminopeptidase [Eubacterium sp.]
MSYMEMYRERNKSAGERYGLVMDRIRAIGGENTVPPQFAGYFKDTAAFILKTDGILKMLGAVEETVQAAEQYFKSRTLEQLKQQNLELYGELLKERYSQSYLNPEYAVSELGEEFGGILSCLRAEIQAMVPYAFEMRIANITILAELFVEIYNLFEEANVGCEKAAAGCEEANIGYDEVRQPLYWFFHDYSEWFSADAILEDIDPAYDFFTRIVMESDLSDLRYLYRYGAYISKNELEIADFLNGLPQEEIQAMADTVTEGYRIGFEVTKKDLSKKKIAEVHYPIGFERVIRAAVLNLEKLGLKATIRRESISSYDSMGMGQRGCYSTMPNRQFRFDHQFDQGYYMDKAFVLRKLEVIRDTYEKNKAQAALVAGPVVTEVFGENPFSPQEKAARRLLDEKQQELRVFYTNEAGQITNKYIIGEERSFTVIAYPLPEIGKDFKEIFAETVRLNTLDYAAYRNFQEKIIAVLDQGEYVKITGKGENRTDLTVRLHPLEDSEKQTNFENCVADVNIPVGEVFTSPVLAGTNGRLHVTQVFLSGLKYENLEINFKNGMIESYGCTNFGTEEENKKFVFENVLMNHETLPLGEFAIGTNTTAYRMARKFRIADKLPILIAEKTGPHFAVGDTCYSHAEDIKVYNPDGKEIVARDNEASLTRLTDPDKAYFNCHTDITIPYDELDAVTVVTKDGANLPVMKDGKFAVAGCEELNLPLEER